MENTPSNKTEVLTKSLNMRIWGNGTSNQLFVWGSHTPFEFQKNKVVSGKSAFFVIGPFCTPRSICLNIGFWQGSFVWKCCDFICGTLN